MYVKHSFFFSISSLFCSIKQTRQKLIGCTAIKQREPGDWFPHSFWALVVVFSFLRLFIILIVFPCFFSCFLSSTSHALMLVVLPFGLFLLLSFLSSFLSFCFRPCLRILRVWIIVSQMKRRRPSKLVTRKSNWQRSKEEKEWKREKPRVSERRNAVIASLLSSPKMKRSRARWKGVEGGRGRRRRKRGRENHWRESRKWPLFRWPRFLFSSDSILSSPFLSFCFVVLQSFLLLLVLQATIWRRWTSRGSNVQKENVLSASFLISIKTCLLIFSL